MTNDLRLSCTEVSQQCCDVVLEFNSIRQFQQRQHLHLEILTNAAHLRLGQCRRQIYYSTHHVIVQTTDKHSCITSYYLICSFYQIDQSKTRHKNENTFSKPSVWKICIYASTWVVLMFHSPQNRLFWEKVFLGSQLHTYSAFSSLKQKHSCLCSSTITHKDVNEFSWYTEKWQIQKLSFTRVCYCLQHHCAMYIINIH